VQMSSRVLAEVSERSRSAAVRRAMMARASDSRPSFPPAGQRSSSAPR
jgi:hypothetical protein